MVTSDEPNQPNETRRNPDVPDISDGMSADSVWRIIDDVLDSVKLAGGGSVHSEVADYVANYYGESLKRSEWRNNVELGEGEQLQIVVTSEGIILDLFENDELAGTFGQTFDEIADQIRE